MLLSRLQNLIGGIYDVEVAHDVYDFLVTDRRQLPCGARGGHAEEELIVAEPAADGGELALALYLDPALLERLAREDPLERLHAGNVGDCWTALEGVSHFLYLAWHAAHDRPVSLLELEMQAEIDKYVVSCWLLQRQLSGRFPLELHHVLFARTRIDPHLPHGRAGLYREASRYAEKFCRRLGEALCRTPAGAAHGGGDAAPGSAVNQSHPTLACQIKMRDSLGAPVLAELRRFYRFTNARKRAHIERGG